MSGRHLLTRRWGRVSISCQPARELQLVVNTPAGPTPRTDQTEIHTTAVYSGVPIMTTLSSAKAALLGIATLQKQRYAAQGPREAQ